MEREKHIDGGREGENQSKKRKRRKKKQQKSSHSAITGG